MTGALQLEGVCAFYGSSQILHGIDLTVAPGTVACLLGRNGMGKTTTLRTIMGLVDRMEGQISVAGSILAGPPHHRFRQGVTLVPEDRKVFPNLTVLENLMVAAGKPGRRGGGTKGFVLEDATRLFPRLRERFDQKAGTLSGGEQQMLVVARAMLANPHFMLLDEPTEGLAPSYVEAIRDSIIAARDLGIGVVLVEQSLPLARAVGDRFHIMENGELLLSADRDAILADPDRLEAMLTVE